MRVQGYRITGKFTVACKTCGGNTTLKFARAHSGSCKRCTEPEHNMATREEQHARYIDCGPQAWDDK